MLSDFECKRQLFCCIFQTFTIFDINMLFTLVFIVMRVCAHRRYSFSVAIIMWIICEIAEWEGKKMRAHWITLNQAKCVPLTLGFLIWNGRSPHSLEVATLFFPPRFTRWVVQSETYYRNRFFCCCLKAIHMFRICDIAECWNVPLCVLNYVQRCAFVVGAVGKHVFRIQVKHHFGIYLLFTWCSNFG